jgi:hypothetical protein
MTPQAQLAMIAWFVIIFYIFKRYPPRTAVIVSFLGGLLFLPQRAGFSLPLIPDYQGMVAICYGIVINLFLRDSKRLKQLRITWLDLPMLIWCICPFFSSITNDLGIYDGLNESMTQIVIWGFPYILGKLYLNNLASLTVLTENIVKAGLIYVPLCIWEGLMGPNLHLIVYGYYAHPSGITQAIRYGGYRPVVFMQHGLMVGMWMMTVALVTMWLWQSKTIKKVWGYSVGILVPILIFTVIWVRSTGAYIYFVLCIIILVTAKFLKNSLPLLILIVIIFTFIHINVTGNFQGDGILQSLREMGLSEDRIQSLQFRWENEVILGEKARERLWFGWGGWNRNRVYEENWLGEWVDVSVTDSLWIIAFGIRGVVGLYSITTALLLPPLLFTFKYPPKIWFHPQVAPAAVLSVCVCLYMLDSVFNSMYNPIFLLISGGLTELVNSSNIGKMGNKGKMGKQLPHSPHSPPKI